MDYNIKFVRECLDEISKLPEINPMHMEDYLRTCDLNQKQLLAVYHTACLLERLHHNNVSCKVFDSGIALSNFRDKSTRTRSAFLSAASLLGLTVQDFDESKSQASHGETTRETATMLSFLTEAIGIRDDLFIHHGHKYQATVADSVQESFEAGVLPQRPAVINLQCDEDHPTQSMADVMHLVRHFGGSLSDLRGKNVTVSWAYSPSYGKPLSVPQGLITLLPRFGVNVTLAYPEGYDLLPDTVEKARNFAKQNDCSFRVLHDMSDAFTGADVVYPKSWAPVHIMEKRCELLFAGKANAEEMKKLEEECTLANKVHESWECTEEQMLRTTQTYDGKTKGEALYMHCLPADISSENCERGEVASSVFARHRFSTYSEASHKPFVVAAAIFLHRFKNPREVLQGLVTQQTPIRKGCAPSPSPSLRPLSHRAPLPAPQSLDLLSGIEFPSGTPAAELDGEIVKLAEKYAPLASKILKEAIRIPEDHVAEDPACGTSNHEGPRVEYLKKEIAECGAVEKESDVFFDEFGCLVWTVSDPEDDVPLLDKKVIYFDGHTDTVNPLPGEWTRKIGGGVDVYKGLTDATRVNETFLRSELGYLPPKSEWHHLIFGRGGADQLSGVVAQIITTKILLELRHLGSLKGVIVRSYGTVAEEDNDGGGPMHVMNKVLPQHPELIPDVVLHTEGTGDTQKGACGIYIGQRGRMQIQVEIIGRSSHGSMPWEGLNPLEYGSRIIAEAQERFNQGVGFLTDPFLGGGTRTASHCEVSTPSTCAVPASFRFRFDRRMTVGETPAMCLEDINQFRSVQDARADGLTVQIKVPHYKKKTWVGYTPDNAEVYMGWMTPPTHPSVHSAYESWKRVVTHTHLGGEGESKIFDPTQIQAEPRLDRWIFSTDGVGYPVKKSLNLFQVPAKKMWVEAGEYHHPAQIGMGIGFEQNTHKIGEFVDERHFPAAIAFMARFPSLYVKHTDVK